MNHIVLGDFVNRPSINGIVHMYNSTLLNACDPNNRSLQRKIYEKIVGDKKHVLCSS